MNEPILVMAISAAILFVLLLVKILIVFRASRRKNLRRWFYYTQQEIVEAPTNRIGNLRKTQNVLTPVFFVLAVIAAFLLYLLGK